MSRMELRLLGPLEAVEDSRPLVLGGAQQREAATRFGWSLTAGVR